MTAERLKRKLAAILHADVVGYSRLMGEDEEGTLKTLSAYFEVMGELIRQYRGRVVGTEGDAILAEFASVVDAVQCAVEIQEVLKAKNADLPQDRKMEIRIGVNLGDVIEEGDNIYGDGVNIAARIEVLAEGGGICISGSAYDQIKNKLALGYEYLGEQSVKNIAELVRVYKVPMEPRVGKEKKAAMRWWQKAALATLVVLILGALAVWNFYLRPAPPPAELALPDKPSIAVLPFVNMSDDPKQEYFSDGITEELISALAKLEGLKVISRTSAFFFKGKGVDLRSIGEKLKVDNILEGSVRKAGNKLRITAQLIKVADDSHLWAEIYDREMEDVFTIQEEISRAIVDKLKPRLLGKRDKPLVKHYTENIEAYNLYRKGRFYWNKASYKEAIEYFEQALALDPNYALAYTGLSEAYNIMGFFLSGSAKEYYLKAKAAAMKALEIDDMLPAAHASLGTLKSHYEWDWKGAERALKRAIELDPGNAYVHSYYGEHLTGMGHFDDALAELNKALELDPLSIHINRFFGLHLDWARKFDQSIKQFEKTLELYPDNPIVLAMLGAVYNQNGRYEDSIAVLKKAMSITSGKNPFVLGTLGLTYGLAGKRKEAQGILDEVLERSKKGYFSPLWISLIYIGLDDRDKAFEWLERAYEERDPTIWPIKVVTNFRSLHSDPRWNALMKKMGLEE